MSKSFCTIQESSYEDWETKHSSNCCFGATGTYTDFACSIPSSTNGLPTLRHDYPSIGNFLQILAMEDGWKKTPQFNATGKVGDIYFGLHGGQKLGTGSHVVFAREGAKHFDDFEKMVLAFDRLYTLEHDIIRTFVMTEEVVKQIIKTPGYRLHKTNGPLVKDTAGNSYFFINDKRMTQEEYEKHFDIKEAVSAEEEQEIEKAPPGKGYTGLVLVADYNTYAGDLEHTDPSFLGTKTQEGAWRELEFTYGFEVKSIKHFNSDISFGLEKHRGYGAAIVFPMKRYKEIDTKLSKLVRNLLKFYYHRNIDKLFDNEEFMEKLVASNFAPHNANGPFYEDENITLYFINGKIMKEEDWKKHFGKDESIKEASSGNNFSLVMIHYNNLNKSWIVSYKNDVYMTNKKDAEKFFDKLDGERRPFKNVGKKYSYALDIGERSFVVVCRESESQKIYSSFIKIFTNIYQIFKAKSTTFLKDEKAISGIVENVLQNSPKFILHKADGPIFHEKKEGIHFVNGKYMETEEYESHFGKNESFNFVKLLNQSSVNEEKHFQKTGWSLVTWVPFNTNSARLYLPVDKPKTTFSLDEIIKELKKGSFGGNLRKTEIRKVKGKYVFFFFDVYTAIVCKDEELDKISSKFGDLMIKLDDTFEPPNTWAWQSDPKILTPIIESFLEYGKLHKTTGPLYYFYGGNPHYWVNGKLMPKEEFEKHF